MDLSEVFNALLGKGINVKRAVRVRGLSGVYHEFDAVVNDRIGIITAEESICPEDSLRIVLKKMDTELKVVVLSSNPLPESQRYILEEMGVSVIEGDLDKAADKIVLILQQLDRGR